MACAVIGNGVVHAMLKYTCLSACIFSCDNKRTTYISKSVGHHIVDGQGCAVGQHCFCFVDRDFIVGGVAVKIVSQLLFKQVWNGNGCIVIVHLDGDVAVCNIVKLGKVIYLVSQGTVVFDQGHICGFVDENKGHILLFRPTLTESVGCPRAVIILEPIIFTASPMAGGSGALTTAKKVNGACGGNALRRPGNIPGKHILGCGILDTWDLDGLSVIGSHYRC